MISTQVNQPQHAGASSLFGGPASMPNGPTTGAVRLPGGQLDTSALQAHMQAMYPTSNYHQIMSQIGQETSNANRARVEAMPQQPAQLQGDPALMKQAQEGAWDVPGPMHGQPIVGGQLFQRPPLNPQQRPVRNMI